MKYRKRPVVIDAFQWQGESVDRVEEEIGLRAIGIKGVLSSKIILHHEFGVKNGESYEKKWDDLALEIETLNGPVIAKKGEYIIKGVSNEVYPCDADIFEQTYEPVEEENESETS